MLSPGAPDSSAPRTVHPPRNLRRVSTSPGTRHTVLSSMGTTAGGCSFTSCTLQGTAQLHAWGQQLGPTHILPRCPGSYLHRASLMSCRGRKYALSTKACHLVLVLPRSLQPHVTDTHASGSDNSPDTGMLQGSRALCRHLLEEETGSRSSSASSSRLQQMMGHCLLCLQNPK